ncbi:unnamed protein product [Nesidiocoris tenuis]|uniref:Lebercilin domain-containing protein n=1 Tax=Nesidiocoris tenuis TaxID=355587 RepID=A0A6H5GFT7_9HEMI|nr:unnamed protein product [Nesidiocoris tenuis]
MSAEGSCDNTMLKIVLCEEDDGASTPRENCSGDVDRTSKKSYDGKPESSRFSGVRKPTTVRSANYVLAANPYQRRTTGCAQCQSMQNSKNNVGPFTQKIMSAKLLRVKQMQNQLSEMSLKMNELIAENKTLKTLQRRQDNALKKYEGSREQLPQLIKSHNEEVRIINMKFKQNADETDSGAEEESNIKVSVKKSSTADRIKRKPVKPKTAVDSSSSQDRRILTIPPKTSSADSRANQSSIGTAPGRVSISSDPSEENVKHRVSELTSPRNLNLVGGGSPRMANPIFSGGGLSIPSDLTIGNAARMRNAAFPDDRSNSDESDELDDGLAGDRTDYDSETDDDARHETIARPLQIEVSGARSRAEQDIDRIISKACDQMLSLDEDHSTVMNGIEHFSLSKELSQLSELSWAELQKQVSPARDELEKKMEKALPSTDYSLDANEKNHLLRALNMIDAESNPNELEENDTFPPKSDGDIGSGRHQSVRQMFAQNRKKADLMKSLFSSDGDTIPVPEGIN